MESVLLMKKTTMETSIQIILQIKITSFRLDFLQEKEAKTGEQIFFILIIMLLNLHMVIIDYTRFNILMKTYELEQAILLQEVLIMLINLQMIQNYQLHFYMNILFQVAQQPTEIQVFLILLKFFKMNITQMTIHFLERCLGLIMSLQILLLENQKLDINTVFQIMKEIFYTQEEITPQVYLKPFLNLQVKLI